jgi:hypothetical protein
VLTTWVELALPDRFDDAIVAVGLFGPAFDAPGAEGFPPCELEFEPAADDPVEPSAHATPYPVENTAAPTPRATANPPTRPTKHEAPMIVYLPDQRPLCLCGG